MTKHVLSLAILTAVAACAADSITPLSANPGLWETTSVTERSGMPPIPADALAKMPPDQRARIEAQFASKPTTDTKQSCITKEDVAKGFGLDKGIAQSCKRTIVTSTASKLEVKWECTGEQAGSGTMKVEAVDSSHVNALIQMTMGAQGHVMNMKVTTNARRLGDDCGNVKPNGSK